MRPRTPEQLAAIEAAMNDPRGAALCLFALAYTMGGANLSGRLSPAAVLDASESTVDDLFDRLETLRPQGP